MSGLFLLTMFLVPVDWGAAFLGLVIPTIPENSLVTVVALLGTTIVTYNLFLHASATKHYWEGEPAARAWKRELRGMAVFIPLGGVISFAIMVSGAALSGEGRSFDQVTSFATLLEPLTGGAARVVFGIGLFAAGITSAITAPLAAASGITEIFGRSIDAGHPLYRVIWLSVLLTGLFFSLSGWSPLQVILAAQAANGILLPFIAAFMLYLTFLQKQVRLPGWFYALGVLITLVCAGLGIRTLWWVYTTMT